MFICPNCKVPLVKTMGNLGICWICPACHGRSLTIALLRKNIFGSTINTLWQAARSNAYPFKRRCPCCSRLMTAVPIPGERYKICVDVCSACKFVWFDASEYEVLPVIPTKKEKDDNLSPEAKEKLAIVQLERIREEIQSKNWGGNEPDEAWQWIPALFGMPVEYENNNLSRTPWLTWSLALFIFIVSTLAFFSQQNIFQTFGLIPSQAWRYGGLTFLTSFFIHGGILHLLGNLYFFLIFGDNVEEWLGKWRFLFLIFLSAVTGDIAHIIGDPDSTMPCVGASGGISGIITFYALKFPYARLGFLVRFHWLRLPAIVMFLLWIGMQGIGVWMQLSGFSNVSSLAHLGGAVIGVIFWLITKNQ